MKRIAVMALAAALSACSGGNHETTTLTIATVNNSDMVRLKTLSAEYTKLHPNVRLSWVTLEENVLRQRVTTDVATRGGQFDVVTIGSYEVPIWAQRHWLLAMNDLGKGYAAGDLLPAIRDALSANGTQYASPINGEGSFTMYRTDLFAKAGIVMPAHPSWDFIATAAKKLNDPAHGVYGICLRGKAGWGENMATIVAMSNSFGARLFDEHWRPQFDTPEWKKALAVYVDLARNAGPPGMVANGFNESLALYAAGKCAIWFDSTVGAPFVTDPKTSVVADKTGFAGAPDAGLGRTANWLWTWGLAIPASSTKAAAAKSFVAWATGPDYAKLVASRFGWAAVPPGTRTSLYANPAYRRAAPFADWTLKAIAAADTRHPTIKPVPYVGVQYAAIPEFQGLGTEVGQQFAGAVAGTMTVDEALIAVQTSSKRQMATASRQ